MDLTPPGDRIRAVRKRRGLTQRELAAASGLSISWIKKLEQGDAPDVRLETLHKLAIALRVPTSSLASGPDAAEPEQSDVDLWKPVRLALAGPASGTGPDEEPTLAGLRDVFDSTVAALLDSRYSEVRDTLPGLLRDADVLVAVSVNGTERAARTLRSQVRQLTGYMMGQVWQFDVGRDAMDLALDDASVDKLTAMSAMDWMCWTMLRQGLLDQARTFASAWADDNEPRMSKASVDELAAWGRFLILISTAAVRDNRPAEAREALKLARMAAAGIGTEVIPHFNPWQVFGPVTVSMVQAENAIIEDRPDITLAIGERIAGQQFPLPRNWNRHRLDVASAHVRMKHYPEAVTVLQGVRAAAPEWLAQQRYARDILGQVVDRRRTLTDEMRDLADAVRLPL